jgi:hypothetical protein
MIHLPLLRHKHQSKSAVSVTPPYCTMPGNSQFPLRRSDLSLSQDAVPSFNEKSLEFGSDMKTLQNKMKIKRKRYLILLVSVSCILFFLLGSAKTGSASGEEEAPLPYKMKKSMLRKGTEKINHYTIPLRSMVQSKTHHHDESISNSRPHPKESYPEFQEKMYKLTADNWQSYHEEEP